MPKRVSKDVVYDENNKRRFNGAFTGGFSAGYFNTVGTEEGWTPTSFISTRSQHVEFKTMTKEDFMDKEDNPLVGNNLRAQNIFSSGRFGSTKTAARANTVNSILQQKHHYYGIGYVPIQRLHASTSLLEDDRNEVMRLDGIFHESSVNSSRFGISALEDADDMDVYAHTDMRQFDRELDVSSNRIRDIENSEDQHHRRHKGRSADIEGFCYAEDEENTRLKMKIYPPPPIPNHFRERHIFSKPLDWSWVISKDKLTTPAPQQSSRFTGMTEEMEKSVAKNEDQQPSNFKLKFVSADDDAPAQKEKAEKEKIKVTRVVSQWRPAKLLCKRFNIRDPYKNLPDVEKTPAIKSDVHIEDLMPSKKPAAKTVDVGELMKEFSDPLQNVKKADVDLFSSLFSYIVCS